MFYCTFDLVRFGTCKTVMELMNYLTNVKVLSYGQKKLLVVVGNLVQMIFYFLIGATGIFNFILEMKSFSLMYFGFSSIVVFQLQYLLNTCMFLSFTSCLCRYLCYYVLIDFQTWIVEALRIILQLLEFEILFT